MGAGSIMDLIKARRATRRFTDRPVPEGDLRRLVEAGQWAPSGSGRQPCVFIAVDDPVLVERLMAFAPGIIGRPTAVIAICIDESRRAPGDRSENLPAMDAAMAGQNILLEAQAAGLGSCPVLSYDPPTVSRLLGLPSEVHLELLVTLGYPDRPDRQGRRRPLAEVAHRNRFGQPFIGDEAR